MGAYKVLYNDIYNALSESTTIKTVEDYNGQYEDMANNNNIKFPACLIEASRVSWSEDSNNCYTLAQPPQTGKARIRLHIVNQTLKSHNIETKNELFDLSDIVSNLIHRLQAIDNESGTYKTLMRIEEEYIKPNKQLNACVITFETSVNHMFGVPEYTQTTGVTASIQINL